MLKITRLRTDYRKDPIGLDNRNPSFSWNIETDKTEWKQIGYRIIVTKWDTRNVVWDSGRIKSDLMTNIRYAGEPLESSCEYRWHVEVDDRDERVISTSALFEMGFLENTCWKGIWIGEPEEHSSEHRLFRKVFCLAEKPAKARVYMCGLGHYEMLINDQSVSNHVLEPGWTEYRKRCLYTVTDVTALLDKGINALGIMLGDGMYCIPEKEGRYAYFPGEKRVYGRPKFLLQLDLTYEDGHFQQIVSDETFHMAPGPYLYTGMYGGEEYDARREREHFSAGSYIENEEWISAKQQPAPEGTLTAQQTPPLKVMRVYTPSAIHKIKENTYLYDFGTNFSGRIRVRLKTNEKQNGCTVRMWPGEILDETGMPDQSVTGKNYSWDYTLNSKKEQEYAPAFTYSGFRYVAVSGAVPKRLLTGDGQQDVIDETDSLYPINHGLPVIEEMSGEFIYPDMETTGEFHCSYPLYNQIHQLIRQAVLSNIKSVMTDCPHRERLGWLEQTHLIGPSIMCSLDVRRLYEKIEQDMKDAQHENGLVPDTCPEYIKEFSQYHEGFADSPEWGSASVINPWYILKMYGDDELIRRNYDLMRSYVAYLTSKARRGLLHHGLGDWLDEGPMKPFSQNTPVPVIASAIYYYDLVLMEKAAGRMGKRTDADYYHQVAENTKEEYNMQFYDEQVGRYANGSQAAQAMALCTGLVRSGQETRVLSYLVKDIENRNYSITAGDIGHPFVIAALMQYGRNDVIDSMMKNVTSPGYGFQVMNGATTLTEEWDGPAKGRAHGSQNHLMLGSGEEWFFTGLAGIQGIHGFGRKVTDEMDIGRIIICPYVFGEAKEVEAWHRHPYGIIRVHWKYENGELQLDGEIPPNTQAELILPGMGKIFRGSGKFKISPYFCHQ